MNVEELEGAFPGHGKALHALINGMTDPEDYPGIQEWLDKGGKTNSDVELVLAACNEELDAEGVEAIFDDDYRVGWPVAEYINFGDTYDKTILYDHIDGQFLLTSWGDWYEAYEAEKAEDAEEDEDY